MSFVIPRDYSFIAPIYDHVFNKPLSEGHKRIGSLLRTKKPVKEMKVLEVGVGSGLTLEHLPNSIKFTGIDINEKMLTFAHEKAKKYKRKNITLTIMDAQKMSFRTNSFDMVVAASVISAVKDPTLTMKEMIRVTKKGGKIAIITNVRNNQSLKSQIVKGFDPLTKKFLGFRTDIDSEFFHKFKELRMIEKENVNNLFGFPLSSFILFEKI